MSASHSLLSHLRLPSDRPFLEYPPQLRHHEITTPTSNFYLKSPNHLNVPSSSTPFLTMPLQSISANPSPRQSPRFLQASPFQSASKNILPGYFFPNMSSPKNNSKATLTNIMDPNPKFSKHNFTSHHQSGTMSFMPSMDLDNEKAMAEFKAKSHSKNVSVHDGGFVETPSTTWYMNNNNNNRAAQKAALLEMDYHSKQLEEKLLKNGLAIQADHDGFTSQRLRRVQKSCDEKNFPQPVKGGHHEELPFIKAKPSMNIHNFHLKQEENFQKYPVSLNSCKAKVSSFQFSPAEDEFAKPKSVLPMHPQANLSRPASKERKSLFKFASQSQGSIVLHDEEPQVENHPYPIEKKNIQQNPVLHHFDSMKAYGQLKSIKIQHPPSTNEITYQNHQNKAENPLIRSETYKSRGLIIKDNPKTERLLKAPLSRPDSKEKQAKSETRKVLERIKTNMTLNDPTVKGRRLSIDDIIEEPTQSKDFRVAQEFTKVFKKEVKTNNEFPLDTVTHFIRKQKQTQRGNSSERNRQKGNTLPKKSIMNLQDEDEAPSPIFVKKYPKIHAADFVDEVVFERTRAQESLNNKKLIDLLADLDALDTEPAEPIRNKPRQRKGR